MSYIPISDQDKKEMLARIGVETVEDLFCCIPESVRLKGLLNLPGPLSEPEILEYFEERGRKNSYDRYLSFLDFRLRQQPRQPPALRQRPAPPRQRQHLPLPPRRRLLPLPRGPSPPLVPSGPSTMTTKAWPRSES